MKLESRNLDKYNSGRITLTAEEPEDMWHVYNLIHPGDKLTAGTVRKIQQESATGSVTTSRVQTKLTIQVERTEFDTQACVLRVKGRNIRENQFVKMGAYHTLDLELNRSFTLDKEEWDSVDLDRVETACDPSEKADLAAIVMQEGLAHVCLVTSSMTLVRAKIDVNIPRKRRGQCEQHSKGMNRFFEQIVQAVLRHIKFQIVKCVVVASPGFIKDQFLTYLQTYAMKNDERTLIENRSKFVPVHSSSGFKHSLKEVLADPTISARLADTKALGEIKALDDFYDMLGSEPNKAQYGVGHVEKAAEERAVDVLLISDELFRSQNVEERKRYVKIVDDVKQMGGTVRIFSSLHVSGEQLSQLSGIAAILRHPVHFEEDDDDD